MKEKGRRGRRKMMTQQRKGERERASKGTGTVSITDTYLRALCLNTHTHTNSRVIKYFYYCYFVDGHSKNSLSGSILDRFLSLIHFFIQAPSGIRYSNDKSSKSLMPLMHCYRHN